MSKSRQAGFTLIEIILVTAISGSLLAIAFMGQEGLRSRAQFDANVNKVVSTIAEARNEATAGVNLDGRGDPALSPNVPGCPSTGTIPGTVNVFAGTAWSADSTSSPNAVFSVDYYVAQLQKTDIDTQGALTGTACKVGSMSRTIDVPGGLQVNVKSGASSTLGGRLLFVRNLNGSLKACAEPNLTAGPEVAFGGGACTAFPAAAPLYTITLSDVDGHSSQVTIDPSGLARRQN